MQQQPLEYQHAVPSGKPTLRRVFGRVVLGAWALVPCAFVFLVLNASDRSSMQWPAAMLVVFSLFAATVLTLVHWLVIILTREHSRRKARLHGTQMAPLAPSPPAARAASSQEQPAEGVERGQGWRDQGGP